MGKYRKKLVVIDAQRWWQNGDHSEDNLEVFNTGSGPFEGEGKVVRYYRYPNRDGQSRCEKCNKIMHNHGWIDTLEGGHTVCPGDWIIKGIEGEFYPCKDTIFQATYEKLED